MSVFSAPLAPPPSLPQHPNFQPKNGIPPPPHPKLSANQSQILNQQQHQALFQQSKSIESILNESTAGKTFSQAILLAIQKDSFMILISTHEEE